MFNRLFDLAPPKIKDWFKSKTKIYIGQKMKCLEHWISYGKIINLKV